MKPEWAVIEGYVQQVKPGYIGLVPIMTKTDPVTGMEMESEVETGFAEVKYSNNPFVDIRVGDILPVPTTGLFKFIDQADDHILWMPTDNIVTWFRKPDEDQTHEGL